MNERKGWIMVWVGIGLIILVYLAGSAAAFHYGSAFMEGIVN